MANVKIRPRRDTTANWNSYNPVLADGEMGFEIIGTGQPLKLKIGDGNTAWTGLTYAVDFPSIQSAASTASNAASAASTSSANAKTSETNAKASETNAASSASAASTSASNASTSASAASTSAANASTSASAAASSASAASSSASAADSAKTAAASSASAAATSASNAASSATAAANSAASLVVVNDLTTGGTTNALSAEQGKALKGLADGNSASITTLTTDTKFPVTNLVTNGDFSNGTTGWSVYGETLSASSNVLSATGNGDIAYPSVYQAPFSLVINHKYYVRISARVTNSLSLYIQLSFDNAAIYETISNQKQDEWVTNASVITAITASGQIRIFQVYDDAATANGKVIQIKYVSAIDLTATFGAGNEPTAAEMDAILAFYPNSWFNGTVNLASNPKMLPYLLNAIRSKADIAQEAWITPTLLNSWLAYDAARAPKYRKDSMGKVTLSGMAKSGTDVIFTLPVGYRPSAGLNIATVSNDVFGSISIEAAGSVVKITGSNTWVSLENISFYVA